MRIHNMCTYRYTYRYTYTYTYTYTYIYTYTYSYAYTYSYTHTCTYTYTYTFTQTNLHFFKPHQLGFNHITAQEIKIYNMYHESLRFNNSNKRGIPT